MCFFPSILHPYLILELHKNVLLEVFLIRWLEFRFELFLNLKHPLRNKTSLIFLLGGRGHLVSV